MIVLKVPRGMAEKLFFGPSGAKLAVPVDGWIMVWADAATGGPPQMVPIRSPFIASVLFSLDSRVMLADGHQLTIHDVERGTNTEIPLPVAGQPVSASLGPDEQSFTVVWGNNFKKLRQRVALRTFADPTVDIWCVPGVYRVHMPPFFMPAATTCVTVERWSSEGNGKCGPAFIIRDAKTGEPVSEVRRQDKSSRFWTQSPDRRLLAGGTPGPL